LCAFLCSLWMHLKRPRKYLLFHGIKRWISEENNYFKYWNTYYLKLSGVYGKYQI
jgi:hypothetical protein